MITCTLCGSNTVTLIKPQHDVREYYHCHTCELIFVDPRFHLSPNDERERYQTHNNGIEYQGHVNFLNRVIQPCLPLLSPTMIGLDYGCGPVPTLSVILAQHNIRCHNYDPLFAITHPLTAYDFIFATECFEHFFNPQKELATIVSLLKPGGYLGIMTEQWESLDRFTTWYYKRDLTHVTFLNRKTFDYLCGEFDFTMLYADRNRVVVLQKL